MSSMARIALDARIADDSAKCANCVMFRPFGDSSAGGSCDKSLFFMQVTDLSVCSKWERRETGAAEG